MLYRDTVLRHLMLSLYDKLVEFSLTWAQREDVDTLTQTDTNTSQLKMATPHADTHTERKKKTLRKHRQIAN